MMEDKKMNHSGNQHDVLKGIKADYEVLKDLLADIENKILRLAYTDYEDIKIILGRNALDTVDFMQEVVDIGIEVIEQEENKHNAK